MKFSAAELVKIRQAKAWKVTEEDAEKSGSGIVALAGTIFAIVPRTGDYGRYPVVILDANEGETYAIHAFHTLLFNSLREIKAGPGMDVVFTYAGKREKNKEEKDGSKNKYHDWNVVPADGADIDTFDFSAETDEAPY